MMRISSIFFENEVKMKKMKKDENDENDENDANFVDVFFPFFTGRFYLGWMKMR